MQDSAATNPTQAAPEDVPNSADTKPLPQNPQEDIESEIERALDCPCVADLKEGPCGEQFVISFSCFLRQNEDSGGDLSNCINAFSALQVLLVSSLLSYMLHRNA